MTEEVKKRIDAEKKNQTGFLDLSECGLTEIPQEVGKMNWLNSLDLSGNYLTKIEGLETLIQLDTLHLTNNQLKKIEGLETLTQLNSLYLSRNEFTKIEGLETLTRLNSLNSSYNQLTIIEGLETLTQLNSLSLISNQLTKVEGLKTLTLLNSLYLSNNQFTKIEGLETLTQLNSLNLSNNQLRKIEGLEKLTKLILLFLSYNQLTKIEGLEKLTQLNVLDLSNNKLTKIERLEKLTKLNTLDLSDNKLTKIEGLEKLTQLNKLYLYDNQLTKIERLEKLTKLNELALSFNQLTKIESLEQFVTLLDQIELINITNNPFEEEEWINAEILKQVGKDAGQIKSLIKNHLDKKEDKVVYHDLPLKIILLGNSRAGKSTTALSLLDKGANPVDREKSTHGLLIKNLQDDKSTKAIIYDFGGQDYYHNTYGMFFSTASLFVVLWTESLDKNTKSKDTDIESHHFNQKYWLGNIKYYFEKNDPWFYVPEPEVWPSSIIQPIYLVQNLFGEDPVSYKLGTDEIKDFGVQKQFHVSYPISQTDDKKIFEHERQSLYHTIEHWIDSNKSLKQKGFTEEHVRIFNSVLEKHEENKENGTPISVTEFFETFGLSVDDKWFLGILHDRGIIYYLDKKEKIWLNPEGVSFTIHTQLSKEKVKEKEGKFKKDDLNDLFSEDLIDLIDLMLDAGILHWDEYDSLYIIPQYLALKPDNDPLHDLATMDIDNGFFIHFKDYVPHGLMPRLICRFGSNPGKKYYYRDRVIFSMPIDNQGHLAKIQISHDLVQLQLSVQFSLPKDKEYMRKELSTYLWKAVLAAYWDYTHFPFLLSDLSEQVFLELLKKEELVTRETIWFDEIERNYAHYQNQHDSKKQHSQERLKEFELEKIHFSRNTRYTNIDMYLSLDDVWYIDYKKQLYRAALSNENPTDSYPSHVIVTKNKKGEFKEKSVSTSEFNPFIPLDKVVPVPKKLFISYSSKNSAFMQRFKTHLNPLKKDGLIDVWVDRMIGTGTEWDAAIQKELDISDILVYLLSPDFLENSYIMDKELAKGIEYYKERKDSRDKPVKLYFVQLMHNSWTRYKKFSDIQQFLNPSQTGKEIVYIGQPDNDEKWVKVIEDFEKECLPKKE